MIGQYYGHFLYAINYLEDQKEEYQRIFEKEEQKNAGLKYSEQVYEYKGDNPKVQYTIRFKDGREITEADYNWFVGMLNNLNLIEQITFYSTISYSSNARTREHYEYMHLYTWVHFREDTTTIRVDGKNMEEQVYRVHSYLRGTIENNYCKDNLFEINYDNIDEILEEEKKKSINYLKTALNIK